MKVFVLLFYPGCSTALFAQQAPPEGIWMGYDGEWKHVTQQLVSLAEATPCGKVCIPSRAECALNVRGVHAYRHRQLLSVEPD